MSTVTGQLVRVTWEEKYSRFGCYEATLEVRHDDGSMTFLVVPVDRMTDRIPKDELFPPDGIQRGQSGGTQET